MGLWVNGGRSSARSFGPWKGVLPMSPSTTPCRYRQSESLVTLWEFLILSTMVGLSPNPPKEGVGAAS